MALVIKTEPREYSPTYNRMDLVVFQDDPAFLAKFNYRYIIDILITDYISATIKKITTKITPDPIQGFGTQDLKGHIEKFIKENIIPADDTGAFRVTDNAIIKYEVEIGDEYRLNTIEDPIVQDPGQISTSFKFAFGGSLESQRWIEFYNNSLFNDFLMSPAGTNQFLTNNKINKVLINDLGWTWFLTEFGVDIGFMQVKTYTSGGALIGTFEIANTTDTALDQARMTSIPTSPKSLNEIGIAFQLGAQPIIISTVASYTVQLFVGAFAFSELLNFEVEEQCRNYEVFRVHFKNEYGGYDAFNFKLNSKRSSSGQRKQYTTNQPNLTSAGLVYDHSTVTKVNYFTQFSNKISLISDFIDETENDWLKELTFSPQCFVETNEFAGGNGTQLLPATIKDTNSWRELKNDIDKLFIFRLEIELDDNFRQRG